MVHQALRVPPFALYVCASNARIDALFNGPISVNTVRITNHIQSLAITSPNAEESTHFSFKYNHSQLLHTPHTNGEETGNERRGGGKAVH